MARQDSLSPSTTLRIKLQPGILPFSVLCFWGKTPWHTPVSGSSVRGGGHAPALFRSAPTSRVSITFKPRPATSRRNWRLICTASSRVGASTTARAPCDRRGTRHGQDPRRLASMLGGKHAQRGTTEYILHTDCQMYATLTLQHRPTRHSSVTKIQGVRAQNEAAPWNLPILSTRIPG